MAYAAACVADLTVDARTTLALLQYNTACDVHRKRGVTWTPLLKPSLAVTISRSFAGLRPYPFLASFEAVPAIHLLYLLKTPNHHR